MSSPWYIYTHTLWLTAVHEKDWHVRFFVRSLARSLHLVQVRSMRVRVSFSVVLSRSFSTRQYLKRTPEKITTKYLLLQYLDVIASATEYSVLFEEIVLHWI